MCSLFIIVCKVLNLLHFEELKKKISAQRYCPKILPKDIAQRYCTKILPKDIAQRYCPKILPKDIAQYCPKVFKTI